MTTRKQFEAQAIRDAQRRLGVPIGSSWHGTYSDVIIGNGFRIRCSGYSKWILRHDGKVVGNYSNKAGALSKAKKLGVA